jgi:hypothetical protein
MGDSKPNDYGVSARFEVGDRVRVWRILKSPAGTVEKIIDADKFPIKYEVRYMYLDGTYFTEVFDANELTLIDRRWDSTSCNCQTSANEHLRWCNRFYGIKV